MSYQELTAKQRLEILQSSKVVAMVGVSSNAHAPVTLLPATSRAATITRSTTSTQ